MKAAVHRRFGSPEVVTVDDVPEPVPRADEVLVRIRAATVGVVDSVARRGTPFYARIHFGLSRPRFAVLGTDFAGEIQATGPAVTRFAVGDQVFGTIAPRFGAHAEYVCLSEHAAVAPKPANLTYAEAAALVDATALCFLRDKANLQRGQSILINGASAPVPVLLDGQVPAEPGMRAVVPQHRFLGGRGEQTVPGHANTLANATDISGEVKRRLLPGLKAGVSTPRS